jgi:nucleoside-specific outer membrane channel protein Tsx
MLSVLKASKKNSQNFSAFLLSCILLVISLGPAHVQAQPNRQLELLYSDAFDGRGREDQMIATYKQNNTWSVGDSFLFLSMAHLGNIENDGNFYFEWQPRLSLGKLFQDTPLGLGPFSDLFFMAEIDRVHNKRVQKNTYLAGLSSDLALPGFRFFKFSLLARNDPTQTGSTGQITLSWNYPIRLGSQQFSIEGFLDSAGTEGNASNYTIIQPQFLWTYNQLLKFGLEYNYWHNKGRAGFNESAWQLMMRFTF